MLFVLTNLVTRRSATRGKTVTAADAELFAALVSPILELLMSAWFVKVPTLVACTKILNDDTLPDPPAEKVQRWLSASNVPVPDEVPYTNPDGRIS